MKYLKRKDIYLNEAFDMSGNSSGPLGNDINWGDSLVGRMFNSIARRFVVNYNINKIESIAEDIESEFDTLIASGAISESGENDEFKFFKISFLLGKLKELIDNEESVVKIKENVENLADYIAEMDDFKNDRAGIKKELEDSLEHFEDYLKNVKDDNIQDKEEDVQEEEETQEEIDVDKQEVIELIQNISKIISKAEELREKYKDKLNPKVYSKNKKIDFSQIQPEEKDNDIPEEVEAFLKLDKKLKLLLEEENGFKIDESALDELIEKITNDDSKRSVLTDFVKNIKISSNKFSKTNESKFDDFKQKAINIAKRITNFAKSLNDVKSTDLKGELGKYIENFNKSFQKILNTEIKTEKKLFKYSDFMKIYEKSNNGKEIKEFFYKNITLDNWVVNEDKVDEIKETVENSTDEIDKVEIDPILSIVKLFNKAFKVYTTQTIPSGRTDGRVSNRVFRRYTNLTNNSSTPQKPGNGPFLINKVFNKFEDRIQDIIRNEKYKILFNKDTEIVLGDGRKVKGGGKILLKFIQNLLDGDKLYKGNAQKEFFKEYFGIEVSEKKIGSDISKIKNSDTDDNKDVELDDEGNPIPSSEQNNDNENKDNKEPIKAYFEEVNKITDTEGTIYGILLGERVMYYMMILKVEDKYVYVKYSTTFLNFGKYLEDTHDINNGKIKNIETEPKKVYFGKIKKELFDINLTDSIDIKTVNLELFNIDNENVRPENISKIKNIRNIFQLVNKEKESIKFTDLSKTAYGPVDSKNYKDLKIKLED